MNDNEMKSKKIFTLVLSVAIVILLVLGLASIIGNFSGDDEKENELLDLNQQAQSTNPNYAFHTQEYEDSSVEKTTQAPTTAKTEAATTTKATEVIEEKSTKVDDSSTQVINENTQSKYTFTEEDVLTWPLEGGIALSYSMDRTIWFPTMEEYKCNPGVVISSAEGTEILVAASGVVESVEETKEYGTVITVDIGNGYKTIYGQIDNSQNLKAGSTVIEGEILATVGKTTSYFALEGDNLFFKMTKEEKPVNPMDYLE